MLLLAFVLWLPALPGGDGGGSGGVDLVAAAEEGASASARPQLYAAFAQVAAVVGGTATLECVVLGLQDQTVSWVRSRDLRILAHAGVVFTGDTRVAVAQRRDGGGVTRHELRVAHVRGADAGAYECQLNTEPKIGAGVNLTVLEEGGTGGAWVRAAGGGVVRGLRGAEAVLACEAGGVSGATAAPDIRWYKGGRLVTPEEEADGGLVLESSVTLGRAASRLRVRRVGARHAGVYRCQWGGRGATVTLLVGDAAAADDEALAMQSDGGAAEITGGAPAAPPPQRLLALLAAAVLLRCAAQRTPSSPGLVRSE